jgi:hypothetical protein
MIDRHGAAVAEVLSNLLIALTADRQPFEGLIVSRGPH